MVSNLSCLNNIIKRKICQQNFIVFMMICQLFKGKQDFYVVQLNCNSEDVRSKNVQPKEKI